MDCLGTTFFLHPYFNQKETTIIDLKNVNYASKTYVVRGWTGMFGRAMPARTPPITPEVRNFYYK
jgi:hypothetical protein